MIQTPQINNIIEITNHRLLFPIMFYEIACELQHVFLQLQHQHIFIPLLLS